MYMVHDTLQVCRKSFLSMRVTPPPLFGTPGHFKRYSGCRGLVRRMPLLEQTRFRCHELKSKMYFRTKTVKIHRIII